MAKKETKRKKTAKQETSLAKRDKPKGSEIIGTMSYKGKKLNVLRRDIAMRCVSPVCVAGTEVIGEGFKRIFKLKFEAIRAALSSYSKELQEEARQAVPAFR